MNLIQFFPNLTWKAMCLLGGCSKMHLNFCFSFFNSLDEFKIASDQISLRRRTECPAPRRRGEGVVRYINDGGRGTMLDPKPLFFHRKLRTLRFTWSQTQRKVVTKIFHPKIITNFSNPKRSSDHQFRTHRGLRTYPSPLLGALHLCSAERIWKKLL